jgi:hypothetical protein
MARSRQTIVSLDDTPSPCIEKVATVVRVWCVKLFCVVSIIQQMRVLSIDVNGLIHASLNLRPSLPLISAFMPWHKGFEGTWLTHKFVKGEDLNPFERQTVNKCITEYRKRLIDISWFTGSLSKPIARMANKEDKCTGRFYSPPSMALTLRAS